MKTSRGSQKGKATGGNKKQQKAMPRNRNWKPKKKAAKENE